MMDQKTEQRMSNTSLFERLGIPGYPDPDSESVGREHAPYSPEWAPGEEGLMGDANMGPLAEPLVFYDWQDFETAVGKPNAWNLIADAYFVNVADDESGKRERLELRLWMLHPRKGISKGVTVRNVSATALPKIKEYLREAVEQYMMNMRWIYED